jgi:hypothetical protein
MVDAPDNREDNFTMRQFQENLLSAITGLTEAFKDLWLERGAYADLLTRHYGYSQEQLENLSNLVKRDPAAREQAEQAFARMGQAIEAARVALIQELSRQHPPTGRPN